MFKKEHLPYEKKHMFRTQMQTHFLDGDFLDGDGTSSQRNYWKVALAGNFRIIS